MRALWGAFIEICDRLIDLLAICVVACVLFLTFGITLNVLVRAADLGSIDWMLEASEYALLAMTFLGAPWALREGAHVRVDLVLRSIPASLARAFEVLADVLGMATSLILFIWSTKVALASASSHSMVLKILIFPEWWLYTVMIVSGFFLTFEFIRRLVRALRGELAAQVPTEMV